MASVVSVVLFLVTMSAVSVVLEWDPPTENEDGSELTDLIGYKVYYGLSSNDLSVSVDAGSNEWARIEGLTVGANHYFAVTAYNLFGTESAPSEQLVWMVTGEVPNTFVTWKSPLVDIEGNPLPPNAVVSYQVMVATNISMAGATNVAEVLATSATMEMVGIKLEAGKWYISVRPMDTLGQFGPMVPPVAYSVAIRSSGVRELKIVTD